MEGRNESGRFAPGNKLGRQWQPGEQGYTPPKGVKRPFLRLTDHIESVLGMTDDQATKDLSPDNKDRVKGRTLAHKWVTAAEKDAAFAKIIIERVEGSVTQKVEIDDLRDVKDDDLYAEGAAIIAARAGGAGGDSEA